MGMETRTKLIEDRRKHFAEQERRLKNTTGKIKHKIAIISGKGGVGKSTIAANLAVAFAAHGHAGCVGILDADIHGPSIPKILGLSGQRMQRGATGVLPVQGPLGIKVASMDFLTPNMEAPVIWRGPLKMVAIRQFLSDVDWGDLDLLVVDLPPGTGDEPLSIAQLVPKIDGVVIVTMPSELSQTVVMKAVTFARRLAMPIIGVVENMSGFICPHCGTRTEIFQAGGGKRISGEMKVPFLGSIPIDPTVSADSDKGHPFIATNPSSPASKAFRQIVEEIERHLKT